MKKILIAFIILLFAIPAYSQQRSEDTRLARLSPAMMGSVPVAGGAVYTFVQSHGHSDTVTIDLNTASTGHLIVIFVGWAPTGLQTGVTVSDGTNNFQMGTISDAGVNDKKSQFGYLLSSLSGAHTYTVTFPDASHSYESIVIWDFTYTGSATFDVQATAKTASGTAVSSNAITTTGASSGLAIAGAYWPDSTPSLSSQAIGGTAMGAGKADANTFAYSWYRILSGVMTTGSGTLTAGTSVNYVASLISFK